MALVSIGEAIHKKTGFIMALKVHLSEFDEIMADTVRSVLNYYLYGQPAQGAKMPKKNKPKRKSTKSTYMGY